MDFACFADLAATQLSPALQSFRLDVIFIQKMRSNSICNIGKQIFFLRQELPKLIGQKLIANILQIMSGTAAASIGLKLACSMAGVTCCAARAGDAGLS